MEKHGKAWYHIILKINHGKTMENHGKENYEKLNEHGKSNKISLFSKHLFLDNYLHRCEIYNKITIESMFDSI